MKDNRQRAKIVRRRKVANLAAMSRQFSVRNCVIPKAAEDWKIIPFGSKIQQDFKNRYPSIPSGCGIAYRIDDKGNIHLKDDSWKDPVEGYPQHKLMMKKHVEWIYNKETHKTEKVHVASTFPTKKFDDYQKKLWKNLGKAAKMELYTQDKLKKWEKKHPKPCPNDDLFKDEFIPQWEHEKEEALIRIRDFVVSMFDKLPLTGRFKISETGTAQYQEEKIAELKDINGDGHRVNELDKNSKLLKKAQETVNKVHAKRTNLVAGNLKDHKRHKGRVILPQAA